MKVAIIHPWFPQYRKPFFDELIRLGAAQGLEIDIFYGAPPPEWKDRGDSVSHPKATPLRTRFYSFGGKNLVFKSLQEFWRRGPYDLVVLEQAVRNLETYVLLLRRGGANLAFWGHGKTYTKPVGRIQEKIKSLLTNRADWFFSYTNGGADAVIDAGFDPTHITVVRNSIDSKRLRSSIEALTDDQVESFSERYDLKGKTGLFIGGLDASKRLDFLFASSERAFIEDNDFRLLVAGAGQLEDWVRDYSLRYPWLTYLGPLFESDKALAMAAAQVLLMPGRVGLVAVDSFASSTPILTTNWKWHAPEFEYLTTGVNAVVTDDELSSYASAITATLHDRQLLQRLQDGAGASAGDYTVGRMAENFTKGLVAIREDSRGYSSPDVN